MRIFILILVYITLVASTIYQRTDGSTLVLSDAPMEVDLSDVVLPQPSTALRTTVAVENDTYDAQEWEDYKVVLTADVYGVGPLSYGQPCSYDQGVCFTMTNAPFDGASSLWIKTCSADGPYAYTNENFHCFFWDNYDCSRERPGLYTTWSLDNLCDYGWNDRIKSYQCYWGKG